jgi:hypothetical protein
MTRMRDLAVALLVASAPGVSSADGPSPPATRVETMIDAKSDCEALLAASLPFAQKMLEGHGAFHPFGAAMAPGGAVAQLGGDAGEDAGAADVIDLIRGSFIAGAREGQHKATALLYDARVPLPPSGEKSDAVVAELDHRQGYSVVVILPYAIEEGSVAFGEAYAVKGGAQIFAAQ